MHTPVTQLEQHISITLRCGSACCCKRPVQGHIWPHNCLTLQQTYSWPPSYSEQGHWLLKKGCGAQSLLLHLAWMLLLGPLALLCRLSKGCHLGASLGAGVGAGWVVYTPTCAVFSCALWLWTAALIAGMRACCPAWQTGCIRRYEHRTVCQACQFVHGTEQAAMLAAVGCFCLNANSSTLID
jgi:hypothetical protein